MGVSPPFQLPGWCWNVWPGNPSAACLVGFRDGHLSAFSSALGKNTKAEKNKGNGKVMREIFVHGRMNDHPRNQRFLTFLSLRVLGWRIYTFETHTHLLFPRWNPTNKTSTLEGIELKLLMLISTCFGAIFFVSNSNLIGLRFAFGLVFVVGTGTDVFLPRKRGSSLIHSLFSFKTAGAASPATSKIGIMSTTMICSWRHPFLGGVGLFLTTDVSLSIRPLPWALWCLGGLRAFGRGHFNFHVLRLPLGKFHRHLFFPRRVCSTSSVPNLLGSCSNPSAVRTRFPSFFQRGDDEFASWSLARSER